MCKAYVLRFSCAHGILMSLEPCKLGPCPVLKTTSERLPQQPYRCYNCQHRKQSRTSRPSTADSALSRTTSCAPGATILDSEAMDAAAAVAISPFRRAKSFPLTASSVYHPLPGVAKQPSGSVQLMTLTTNNNRKCSSSSGANQAFKFACQSSSHLMTPHYFGLPLHLPHQHHGCPPCQLETLRKQGEDDAVRGARAEYPRLTEEMLVRGGCIKEWQSKPSWEQYAEEKVTEEREMWVHVTRKWTQDLKKCRVLVSEEDGLGLFP